MKYLIPIIVGAIIGYITNWLAIKMLFRPYTEKKVFGIHIPFTPGLIPKEMNRIAKSVGGTIGEYLLSPEIISETLSDKGTKDNIKKWVNTGIEKLKVNHKSIKEVLREAAAEKYDSFYAAFQKKIIELVNKSIKSKEFNTYITDLIKNKIHDENKNVFYNGLKEKASMLLKRVSVSEDTRNGIKNALECKLNELKEKNEPINSVIPGSTVEMVKSYIIEHDQDIIRILKDAIESPVMKIRIKAIIAEIVEQNTNRFITMFLNPDSIAEKVFESIEKYIDNPSNSKGIVMILTTSIDKLIQSNVSNVFSSISPELKDRSISEITDLIIGYISNEERQNKVLELAELKMKEPDIRDEMIEFISDSITNILQSEELSDSISAIVHDGLEWILNKPVSYIFSNVGTLMADTLAGLANDLFEGFVKDTLPHLLQIINIPKIVEDRIIGFDIVFAEGIIIEIANKELKAITWLGALLGGIMGILTPLVEMIYK